MQSLYDHMVLENIFDETGSTRNNEGIQAAAVTSGQNFGDSIEDVFLYNFTNNPKMCIL